MFEAIEEALAEFKATLDAFRNSKKTPEQIEKAKELYDSLDPCDRSLLEYLFPELSESEDERIRKNLIELLLDTPAQDIISHHLELSKVLAYLEKQKEPNKALRLVGKGFLSDPDAYFEIVSVEQKEQKPAEWSEEDEKMVQFWNMYYEHKVGDWPNKDVVEHLERFKEWLNNRLKSLRSRPKSSDTWKPSEEQMKALLSKLPVIKGGGDKVQDILESLYNDLKKLM